VLDYATGHVDFVNAGHNPPLLWQQGTWRWLRESPSMPLGLFDDELYPTYSLDCEPGDKILLYTDGVAEAFSVDDEQYGEDRLFRQVQESSESHPRELVDGVRASVAAYAAGAEQSDDITMLALEVVSV
jgi:serine phosphatase RsbU (regulator of sigma subunit)